MSRINWPIEPTHDPRCEQVNNGAAMTECANKLWILAPVSTDEGSFWSPWYDKVFGFVISAPDEATARAIATDNAGDEVDSSRPTSKSAWASKEFSTCVELLAGDTGIVMRDYNAG